MNVLMSIVFTLLGVASFGCVCWIAAGNKVFEKRLHDNFLAAVLLLASLGNFGYGLYYANVNTTKITDFTTKVAPQVDTLVSIKGDVKDTTYVYHFEDVEK